MASLLEPQIAEFFHVAFLDVLSKRLDSARFVLKGGANLRYFFSSARYSEDIDLDLVRPAPMNLEPKVDEVLASAPLKALLRTGGLEIVDASKPKQTATTRRWKVGIAVPGRSGPTRTKIEFSNRNGDDRHRVDPIPEGIIGRYALRPPSVRHYIDDAPTEQKAEALANRSETQARDVFDLDLLLRRRPLPAGTLEPDLAERASANALALPFAAFRDQVLPFLEADVAELYDSEDSWVRMQIHVAESLGQAK